MPDPRIAQRRSEMPPRFRKTYDAAMTGKSRKASMNAFCYECLGWEVGGATSCSSPECPLYPFTPHPTQGPKNFSPATLEKYRRAVRGFNPGPKARVQDAANATEEVK